MNKAASSAGNISSEAEPSIYGVSTTASGS